MTKDILARANALYEKINNLEWYLDKYAIPSASCQKIRIIPRLRKLIASNWIGHAEYELDYEEFQIVNDALYEQLKRYKAEFEELKTQ